MVIIDYPSITPLSEGKIPFKDMEKVLKKMQDIAGKYKINVIFPSKGDHTDETSTNK